MILGFISAQNKNGHYKGVIMENDSPFYANPQQAKAQAYIPEGTTVTLGEQNGAWTEVTLPDGRTGWMQLLVLSKVRYLQHGLYCQNAMVAQKALWEFYLEDAAGR